MNSSARSAGQSQNERGHNGHCPNSRVAPTFTYGNTTTLPFREQLSLRLLMVLDSADASLFEGPSVFRHKHPLCDAAALNVR